MRSLRQIAELFPAAREAGLTDPQVSESREKFGANRLTPLPRHPKGTRPVEPGEGGMAAGETGIAVLMSRISYQHRRHRSPTEVPFDQADRSNARYTPSRSRGGT